jgi:hypothetical protein
MAKELLFTKLVNESGQPEVVTLWTDPKKDKTFMSLVKAGRILTLIQKPTGNNKDFGLVGFHPQQFAAYLSFPKRLKKNDDAVVIGIKYNLLKKGEGKVMGGPIRIKAPAPVKIAPIKKAFEIQILRSGFLKLTVKSEAFNINDAKKLALAEVVAKELLLPSAAVKNKIVSAREG